MKNLFHKESHEQFHSAVKNGIRGTMQFLFFKNLMEEKNVKESFLSLVRQQEQVGEDKLTIPLPGGRKVKINPARIALTILKNHTEDQNHAVDHDEYDGHVKISTIYGDYHKVFYRRSKGLLSGRRNTEVDASLGKNLANEFLSMMTELFEFSQNGVAHLVTIYGEGKNISDLLTRYISEGLSPEEEKKLAEIEVKLNPSAKIYLNTIASHFEFYTLREFYNPIDGGHSVGQRKSEIRPLFVLTGTAYNQQLQKYDYEFAERIRRTFEFSKGCIDILKKFLLASEFRDFPKGMACPRTEKGKKTLFVKQIIHNHIRYLDCFRIYITHNPEAMQEYTSVFNHLSQGEIICEINRIILSFMKKYNESFSGIQGYSHEHWVKPDDFDKIEQNLCEQRGYKDSDKGYEYVVHERSN